MNGGSILAMQALGGAIIKGNSQDTATTLFTPTAFTLPINILPLGRVAFQPELLVINHLPLPRQGQLLSNCKRTFSNRLERLETALALCLGARR